MRSPQTNKTRNMNEGKEPNKKDLSTSETPVMGGVCNHVLLAVVAVLTVSAGSASLYDKHCDAMIAFAKEAALAFNRGDQTASDEWTGKVLSSYHTAVELDDKDPQAPLNLAVFYSNTHRYDESIEMFEKARELLPKNNRQAQMQIDFGVRRAKYQKFSMLRDRAYSNGEGNVTAAHHYALEQLRVTFDPHIVNHDVGTLEVMRCEYDVEYCNKSANRFRASAYATHGHYLQNRMPQGKERMACLHSKPAVGGAFEPLRSFTETSIVSGTEGNPVYIHIIHENVTVHGDGILTFAGEGHCNIAITSPDFYTNIPKFIPVQSPNGPPPPQALRLIEPQVLAAGTKVLSLAQFSGQAFYHWLCEAVPRLLMAQKGLADFESYSILIPSFASGAPLFITDTFVSLFAEIDNPLIEHRGNTIATEGVTVVTWELQRCPNVAMSHCASLSNPAALLLARTRIDEALGLRIPRAGKYLLIAGGRTSGVSMRRYSRSALYDAVIAATAGGLEVVEFDASEHSLVDGLALFRGAAAVVGVHGGALANMLACRSGTPIVEIGFSTIGAQQYEHIAKALQLPYHRVVASKDPMERSLSAPEIMFDASEVSNAIAQMIALHVLKRDKDEL